MSSKELFVALGPIATWVCGRPSTLSYLGGGVPELGEGCCEGGEDPYPHPLVLTSPISFFSRSRRGGPSPPGAQRPEELSKPLNLTCITVGDASRLLQMRAKNTKEQGPSVMETLRACDMRRWLCGR